MIAAAATNSRCPFSGAILPMHPTRSVSLTAAFRSHAPTPFHTTATGPHALHGCATNRHDATTRAFIRRSEIAASFRTIPLGR